MLTSLHIENYALIRQSDISFDDGFVVITGETGAGKSILLGALSLLLGQRADLQVLQDKQRKCIVEAQWNVSGLSLQPFFVQNELDYDEMLIIRREILPSGKSRAFINDTPVSLSLLSELGASLIDIHSQHQTLTLSNSKFQISLLDTLSANPSLIKDYSQAYAHYVQLKRTLESLTSQSAQQAREQDFLQFQFDELYEAKLIDGEQEELESELSLLSHTEVIKEALATIDALCYSEEGGAVSELRQCRTHLSRITSHHKDLESLYQRLESSVIELEDILSELSSIDSQLSYSPERQQTISERLDLIYRLQKKHSLNTIADLLQYQSQLEAQLQSFSTLDEQIKHAMDAVDQSFSQVQALADQLTQLRHQASLQLGQLLSPVLAQLGMKEARLEVSIAPAADFGPLGHDDVSFLFNANKGGALRELSKVASGGEMSRLMLAIKSLVTQRQMLPTIIFDEIDTGISGDISVSVGNIMRSMSNAMQVIAISHMPQIAAKASQHLKVFKQTGDTITTSSICQLSPDQRATEIAIMLSSDPPTPSALQTARELMQSN